MSPETISGLNASLSIFRADSVVLVTPTAIVLSLLLEYKAVPFYKCKRNV